ncbi:MAG: DUF1638 domain-containing protein [Planctomycetota bacterium]|jgi:hypothetical protein|nr:DUF1638 domain-containing protein [Planctomycetota bacterium]
MPTKIKLMACEALRAETERLIADLGLGAGIDAEWLEMGLHQNPESLKLELRTRLRALAGAGYETVLLLFGLCGRATDGLEPPPGARLVIPRVHDCVSIFLGSARRYLEEHAAESGTYWFSRIFLHRPDRPSPGMDGFGSNWRNLFPDAGEPPATMEEARQRLIERYDEDNAEYLIETLAASWRQSYSRAVYLDWKDSPEREEDLVLARSEAERNGWRFQTLPVDLRLIRMLLSGDWPEDEFVIAVPGQRLEATNGEDALRASGG